MNEPGQNHQHRGIAHPEIGTEQREQERAKTRYGDRRQKRWPEHELDDVGDKPLQLLACSGAFDLGEFWYGERDHRFVRSGGRIYRENRLLRTTVDRRTGDHLGVEELLRNRAPVLYE